MIALVLSFAAVSAAAATTHPARTDDEVWALAERAHIPDAYMAYWKRFRAGAHADEAIERYWKLKGIPAPPPAPPPPPIPSVYVGPLAANQIDPCSKLIVDYQIGASTSEEAKTYLEAQRNNRASDYEAYLARFPSGVCRARATDRIEARKRLRASFSPIPGFGPLAAQRSARSIFTEEDYPVQALRRGEQGTVVAEWDVAADGVAEACRVVQSSGSEDLDNGTCRIIASRLRYDPARDANGIPVRSVDHLTINWTLPEEPPAPAEAAH